MKELRISLLFICLAIAGRGQDMTIEQYVSAYKGLAITEMQRTGVPASISLAQGILETQAGNSDLFKASNNHFGIKCKDSWSGPTVSHDDDARGECFRKYSNAADSYKDHSDFLKGSDRYSFLFRLDPLDYKGWAYGLRRAGYATNPRYAQILIKYIEQYHLQDYSLIAMGKMKDTSTAVYASNEQQGASGTQGDNSAAEQKPRPAVQYPDGEFKINETRVVYAKAGTSLLALAEQYHLSLSHLVDFNDLNTNDELLADQLIFLQRKRKQGDKPSHVVEAGESLYDIAQSEGVRLSSLLEYNQLGEGSALAPGTTLFLQKGRR